MGGLAAGFVGIGSPSEYHGTACIGGPAWECSPPAQFSHPKLQNQDCPLIGSSGFAWRHCQESGRVQTSGRLLLVHVIVIGFRQLSSAWQPLSRLLPSNVGVARLTLEWNGTLAALRPGPFGGGACPVCSPQTNTPVEMQNQLGFCPAIHDRKAPQIPRKSPPAFRAP